MSGEAHEVDHRQVRIYLGERAPDLRFQSRHWALRLQHRGVQKVVTIFEGFKARVIVHHVLGLGQEEHGRNFAGRVPVMRILGDADDFKASSIFLIQIAKVFSDRVFIFEELLGKCLIDDGYFPGSGSVLLGDGAAFHYFGSNALKVAVGDPEPGGLILTAARRRWRLPFDVNGLTPIIAFHRRVEAKAHALHARNCRQIVTELPIKRGQSLLRISGHRRIHMQDVAVRNFESKILALHVAQAPRQQSRGAQQNQR